MSQRFYSYNLSNRLFRYILAVSFASNKYFFFMFKHLNSLVDSFFNFIRRCNISLHQARSPLKWIKSIDSWPIENKRNEADFLALAISVCIYAHHDFSAFSGEIATISNVLFLGRFQLISFSRYFWKWLFSNELIIV